MKLIIKLNLFVSIYLLLPSVPFACQPSLGNHNISSTDHFTATTTTTRNELLDKLSNKTNSSSIPVSKTPTPTPRPTPKPTPTPTPTSEVKTEVISKRSEIPTPVKPTKCLSDPSEVAVPKYTFYIIGLIMIILLAAIIFLGVLLFKKKNNEYKVLLPSTTSAPINVDVARKYITQTSQEMTLLNISSDNKHDTIPKIEETQDISTKITPQNPIKIYKSIRKPVDHQIILREQMKKICEDALAKSHNNSITASLKDLNNYLTGFDDDKREKPQESIAREKSASYPQLDIYDEPPARRKPVDENDVDIPVYDCLPSSNNIIVQDYNSDYLLALSKENCSDMEPNYINAKNRYN